MNHFGAKKDKKVAKGKHPVHTMKKGGFMNKKIPVSVLSYMARLDYLERQELSKASKVVRAEERQKEKELKRSERALNLAIKREELKRRKEIAAGAKRLAKKRHKTGKRGMLGIRKKKSHKMYVF